MARTDIQMNIRIPELLKFRLETAAKQSGRSVTAEIVERLDASFPESFLERLAESRQEEMANLERLISQSARSADRLKASGATEDFKRMQLTTKLYQRQFQAAQMDLLRLRAEQAAHRKSES